MNPNIESPYQQQSSPAVGNSQPQSSQPSLPVIQLNEPSAKKIRVTSLILMLIMCVIPIPMIFVIIWLEKNKQYRLSTPLRALILIVSGVVGPIMAFFGAIAGLDTYGSNYPVMISGLLLTLAPFLYSLIKPLK